MYLEALQGGGGSQLRYSSTILKCWPQQSHLCRTLILLGYTVGNQRQQLALCRMDTYYRHMIVPSQDQKEQKADFDICLEKICILKYYNIQHISTEVMYFQPNIPQQQCTTVHLILKSVKKILAYSIVIVVQWVRSTIKQVQQIKVNSMQ